MWKHVLAEEALQPWPGISETAFSKRSPLLGR